MTDGSHDPVAGSRPRPVTALLVEDNSVQADDEAAHLRRLGFDEVLVASDVEGASEILLLERERIDFVVVDLSLQGDTRNGHRVVSLTRVGRTRVGSWCSVIILTGHAEDKELLGFYRQPLFEKGREHEQYTEFAREVAERARARLRRSSPFVSAEFALSDTERRACVALDDASQVAVERRLSGSFRQGAVLLLVDITPDEPKGGVPPTYRAVLKVTTRSVAELEHENHRKLLRYHHEIESLVPPYALRIHPVDEASEFLEGAAPVVVVTPQVDGETLYTSAQKRWFDPMLDRRGIFTRVFSELRAFLDGIARRRECEHSGQDIFLQYYRPNLDRASRWAKAIEALTRIGIDATAAQVRLRRTGIIGPNPLVLLRDGGGSSLIWRSGRLRCEDVTYGHGDFHAGNILVSCTSETRRGIYVLDYDSVNTYCRHFDPAQLETSFLLALATHSAFEDARPWHEQIEPTLRLAVDPNRLDQYENNRMAFDVHRVFGALDRTPRGPDRVLLNAARYVTLLRVLTSQLLRAPEAGAETPLGVIRTGVAFALLLGADLIDVAPGGTIQELDL